MAATTLAAAYMIGRVPALLSDVLVSGGTRAKHHPIATRVDLNEPLPLDWEVRVNGLSRKLIKVGTNAAVAGAGNGLAMSVIYRELEEHFRQREVTAEAMAEQLAEMDVGLSTATSCTFVGWIMGKGAAHSFRWESVHPKEMHCDGDHIIGTGADLFKKIAWSEAQRKWDAIDNYDHAQHYALTQISSLLINEISNGSPIQNLFGGGYDLLLWDDTQFRQAADVSFLFLSLEWLQLTSKSVYDPAPILIRQAELEDCLVIRAIIPNNQLAVTSDTNERLAIIAPITSLGKRHAFNQTHSSLQVPHFADRIFVNITRIGLSGTPQHWSGGVSGEQAKLFRIEADQQAGKIRFVLPISIIENMRQAAETHLVR